jgi:hypothetical protein
MSRSGQDARKPPRAIAPASSSAPEPRTPGSDHRTATRLVWLAVVHHMLHSRRFYERVAVAAIALRALRQMGQENRASTMERLAAWNRRELQRLEGKAKQPARAVRGTGQMARSRPSKDLAKMMDET